MRFTDKLFHPIQNCEETTIVLCKALQIAYTRKALIGALLTHPDYPSLLAVSDVMKDYGVENISIYLKDTKELMKISQPFIAQIVSENKSGKIFALVYSVSETKVSWYNPEKHKREEVAFDEFAGRFTGYMQVFQKGEVCGENEYEVNRLVEKQQYIKECFYTYFIPILAVIVSVISIIKNGVIISVFPILYMFLVLVGVVIGIMLLIYEIDQNNPTLQRVCSMGQKMSCSAILNSQGAKIIGIHWSVIGVSYFLGGLLSLLVTGISHDVLIISAWLSLLALFYVIYSVYYQGLIVKQWCTLCLIVQGLLVLQFLTALNGGFLANIANLSIEAVILYAVMIAFSFLLVNCLMFGLQKNKSSKYYFKTFQRIKHDTSVFETLLTKQKQISELSSELGITLGNPQGEWHIVKVCNPYCTPCAMVHPILDSILESSSKIKLQIIFTVAADNSNERNNPIKLFLALQESHQDVRKALVDWFNLENKNYNEFAGQYSVSDTLLNAQTNKMELMRDWCINTKIRYTPTIFVNNYQLPDIYTVTDLRYFLSV